MAEIVTTVAAEIRAPIEHAFAYRLDFTNLPEYNPNVSNLRRTDAGTEPGVGAEYLFDLTVNGGTGESPLRVTDVESPSTIIFDTGPGYMAREVCSFTPTESGTLCEFEITVTIPGEINDDVRAAIDGATRDQALLELELMKKNLEG